MGSETVLWSLSLLLGLEYEILFGSWLDAALILGLTAWRDGGISAPVEILDEPILSIALKTAIAVLAAYTWFRLRLSLIVGAADNVSSAWTGPGKPLLIPARTTHRRIFPEKHGFSYSYLVVGVPVGWQGSGDGMISTNAASLGGDKSPSPSGSPSSRAWFHVDGGDHLLRGPGTLREKLHDYLESQDVDPASYPHAYLVTAASFLGYSFNPVSFWYLYSEAKELSAMVLEVNNTFGERRMYLLRADDAPCTEEKETTSTFKRSWPKDFHVSPFNSRKGAYSAQIHDVLASDDGDRPGRLDGTITLSSSQGHAKIVARLFAEGDPVDPSTMSLFHKARFLLGWWWVGFATFPRIAKEAAVLFFRRNLHVWYRPEPLKETIGRAADSTERDLAPLFREYLRHLVGKSTANITVKYIPSAGNEQSEIMRTSAAAAAAAEAATENAHNAPIGSSKGANQPDDKNLVTAKGVNDDPNEATQHLEFQVLTPAFYTRFVHYAHDFEAVFSELRDDQTIHVSRPELLPSIFVSQTPAPPLRVGSPLDFVYFSAIRSLRGPPERIERPLTSSATAKTGPSSRDTPTHMVRDVRGFRISGLDGWVLSGAGAEMRRRYRSLVLRLFLAEKVALGSSGLLWIEEFVLRAGVAWMLLSGFGCMVAKAGELYDRFL